MLNQRASAAGWWPPDRSGVSAAMANGITAANISFGILNTIYSPTSNRARVRRICCSDQQPRKGLPTVLTSDNNQARGVGGRTDHADGVPGNHPKLVAFVCCQSSDGTLAVVYVIQVGFEPATLSLSFLYMVTSNFASAITFGCVPFECDRVTSHIYVIRLTRRI